MNEIDKNFEYDCLREFYKIVDCIRLKEDEVKFEDVLKVKTQMKMDEAILESRLKLNKRENKGKKSSTVTIKSNLHNLAAGDGKEIPRSFGLFIDSNGKTVWHEKPVKSYSAKMLHMIDETLDEEDFTVLDYPCEYPEAVEIINFIVQQGFSKSLNDEKVYKEFKEIYNQHVLENFRASKQIKDKSLTHPEMSNDSCVVPLPLVLQQYTIDLGEILVNGRVEKIVRIFFHGSDVKAALRTETFVPGFTIKFLQNSEMNNFTKIVDYDMNQSHEVYQNRYHRESEITETQKTVKRCHSFDFTSARVHTRRVPTTARERQEINQVYNEMMSTKQKVEKNPFLQSEITGQLNLISGPRVFEFKITLTPLTESYKFDTDFDEIVFLDVSYRNCEQNYD